MNNKRRNKLGELVNGEITRRKSVVTQPKTRRIKKKNRPKIRIEIEIGIGIANAAKNCESRKKIVIHEKIVIRDSKS